MIPCVICHCSFVQWNPDRKTCSAGCQRVLEALPFEQRHTVLIAQIPDDNQWDGDSRRGRKKKTFEVE